MPEICRFNGITIHFYYEDHNPPHFHAIYGKQEAVFSIETLEIIEGKLPRNIALLVIQWAYLNRKALLENWEIAKKGQVPHKIKPFKGK